MHTFYESVSVLEERRGVTSIESKEAVASSLFRNRRWKRVSLTAVAGVACGEREDYSVVARKRFILHPPSGVE